MINSKHVQSVVALMERHGISTFDYERGSVQLRLTLGSDEATIKETFPQPVVEPDAETIRSPAVGIVLHSHPARAQAPEPLPRSVVKGEVVAYVRTGLTLRAVTATRDCILLRALANEGRGIGYGGVLFEVTG